jgi:hypothetical protein
MIIRLGKLFVLLWCCLGATTSFSQETVLFLNKEVTSASDQYLKVVKIINSLDIKSGKITAYYDTLNMSSKRKIKALIGQFEEGKTTGIWTFYTFRGSVAAEGELKEFQPWGSWKFYHDYSTTQLKFEGIVCGYDTTFKEDIAPRLDHHHLAKCGSYKVYNKEGHLIDKGEGKLVIKPPPTKDKGIEKWKYPGVHAGFTYNQGFQFGLNYKLINRPKGSRCSRAEIDPCRSRLYVGPTYLEAQLGAEFSVDFQEINPKLSLYYTPSSPFNLTRISKIMVPLEYTAIGVSVTKFPSTFAITPEVGIWIKQAEKVNFKLLYGRMIPLDDTADLGRLNCFSLHISFYQYEMKDKYPRERRNLGKLKGSGSGRF